MMKLSKLLKKKNRLDLKTYGLDVSALGCLTSVADRINLLIPSAKADGNARKKCKYSIIA